MAAWVLFGILIFLVFGIPLIDEVYSYRARRGRQDDPRIGPGEHGSG